MDDWKVATHNRNDFYLAISFSIETSTKFPSFECLSCNEYDATKESFRDAWQSAKCKLNQHEYDYIDTILEKITELFDELKLEKVLSFYLVLNNNTLMILVNRRESITYHKNHNHKILILRIEVLMEIIKNMIVLSEQKIAIVIKNDEILFVVNQNKSNSDEIHESQPIQANMEPKVHSIYVIFYYIAILLTIILMFSIF